MENRPDISALTAGARERGRAALESHMRGGVGRRAEGHRIPEPAHNASDAVVPDRLVDRLKPWERIRSGGGALWNMAVATASERSFWYGVLNGAAIAGGKALAMHMGGADAAEWSTVAVGAAAGALKEAVAQRFYKSEGKGKAVTAILTGAVMGAAAAEWGYRSADSFGMEGAQAEAVKLMGVAGLAGLSTFIKNATAEGGLKDLASWKTVRSVAISAAVAGGISGAIDWVKGPAGEHEVGRNVSSRPSGDSPERALEQTLTTTSTPVVTEVGSGVIPPATETATPAETLVTPTATETMTPTPTVTPTAAVEMPVAATEILANTPTSESTMTLTSTPTLEPTEGILPTDTPTSSPVPSPTPQISSSTPVIVTNEHGDAIYVRPEGSKSWWDRVSEWWNRAQQPSETDEVPAGAAVAKPAALPGEPTPVETRPSSVPVEASASPVVEPPSLPHPGQPGFVGPVEGHDNLLGPDASPAASAETASTPASPVAPAASAPEASAVAPGVAGTAIEQAVSNFDKEIPVPQGSTPWAVAEGLLKQVNPNKEVSLADIRAVDEVLCRENGIAVPEWGIEGKVLATNIPAGMNLQITDEVRKAVLSAASK